MFALEEDLFACAEPAPYCSQMLGALPDNGMSKVEAFKSFLQTCTQKSMFLELKKKSMKWRWRAGFLICMPLHLELALVEVMVNEESRAG